MIRYMILVKASKASEGGALPTEEMLSAMADYHEPLAKAGVLVDGNGLHPSAKGWRINWKGGKRIVTDGPFAETKEIIGGHTINDVASREDAVAWANLFPNPHIDDGEIEIRQMFELEELGTSDQLDRFRRMEMGIGKPK